MKVVIAPDSFKESLDAMAVATCIEKGFSEVFPNAEYVKLPLADGGEGTVEVLLQGLNGEKQTSRVTGPLGEPVDAMWALLNEKDGSKTALIEIAMASGLDLITPEQRDPLKATSFGTGETIKAALDAGATKILLGLGGSATNDGGAGILQALGGKLLDAEGNDIARGGAALSEVAQIDLSDIDSRCDQTEFVVACDVSNPLCGENGASAIFGPQKGATEQNVQDLDKALANFAEVAEKLTGINHKDTKGFGAAGGAPMALSLAFNIQIKQGIDMVLDTLNADEVLEGADLVITGEGQMDNQTLQGKTPFGIAKRAQARDIPVIGIAGSLGKEVEELYSKMSGIFGTVRSPQPLAQVLEEADKNLTRTARNIASILKLGSDKF
ncbi:glycerate kinase [Vibrio sp. JC009]|uniref:glycerate kinase n=1 Tax=Vibrio sp. JC009 TaxID=2912314 RepID=UPI0023AFA1EF|nr:glycerate kinase [Vibrio sp. JC009]WED23771.1 glycerate kinase [Vibrio sp. JC009]